MTIVKKLMPITIIIALISITLLSFFNLNNQLVYTEVINGITIYRFDINTYLMNIKEGWNTDALDFTTIIPVRRWDSSGNLDAIANNIAVVFDYMYFPINFILYPLRWVAYVIKGLGSLIGWPIKTTGNTIAGWGTAKTQEYTSVLITILEWIKINLIIPYI